MTMLTASPVQRFGGSVTCLSCPPRHRPNHPAPPRDKKHGPHPKTCQTNLEQAGCSQEQFSKTRTTGQQQQQDEENRQQHQQNRRQTDRQTSGPFEDLKRRPALLRKERPKAFWATGSGRLPEGLCGALSVALGSLPGPRRSRPPQGTLVALAAAFSRKHKYRFRCKHRCRYRSVIDVCMYVCMHACVCMFGYMHRCIYVCVHVALIPHVCMHVCMRVFICVYIHACGW